MTLPAPTPPPVTRPFSWRALLAALWRWLVNPEGSPPEAGHMPVQLLSWLTLSVAALIGLAALVPLAFTPLRSPGLPVALTGAVLLLVAYGLNRAGHHMAAAVLAITVLAVGVWGAILAARADPQFIPWLLPYTLLSVLLTSLLLSPRAAAALAAAHLAGAFLLPTLVPSLETVVLIQATVFITILSTLVIAVAVVRQRNLAEIQRQTRELADEQLRFRLFLDLSPDAILVVDPHQPGVTWPIVDCNEAACRMNGYTRAELIGQSIDLLRPLPNNPDDLIAYLEGLRTQGVAHYEVVYRRKNGELYPLDVSATLITVAGRELILGIDRDISERKQAEAALRQSEERLELVSYATNDAVWDWDLSTQRVWWNHGIRHLFGYTAAEVGEDNDWFESRLHPDDAARVVDGFRGVIEQGGEFWSSEYRFLRADGAYAHVFDRGYVIRNEAGKPQRLIGAMMDITERKRAEETLRQSEARHRALFEESPVSLWEEDFSQVKQRLAELRAQGVRDVEAYLAAHPEFVNECAQLVTITDVNKATVKLCGAASKAELLHNLDRVVGFDASNSFLDELTHVARGETEFEREGVTHTLAGERLSINLHWVVVPGYEDSLAKVMVSVMDITERKKMEEALRESEELFRTSFEHSPVGIALLSPNGEYLMVNRSLCAMLGYTEAEMRGRLTSDFTHPDDIASGHEQAQQLASGQLRVAETEKRYLHRSGRVIWTRRIMSPLRVGDNEARFYISQIHDISEYRRAQEELSASNSKLTVWLAELEQRTREMALLNDLVSLFQTCRSPDEAYVVIGKMAPALFPGDSGGLSILRASRNLVETTATWGEPNYMVDVFQLDDCWAMRRAQAHLVLDGSLGLTCGHLSSAPPAYLCVPLFAQGDLLGCLHLNTAAGQLTERKQQLAKTVADAIALSLANLRLRESLRQQSIIDVLTGLFNRRYMEETLEREVRRCLRAGRSLGVIMMDLDHFKAFNDTYGHGAGDVLLAELGSYLRSRVRADDIACRYGGEEFTLILPDTSLEVTIQRAEMLHAGMHALRVEYGGQILRQVTLSLGVAAFPDHAADGAAVLLAADRALYVAKHRGRDQVVAAPLAASSVPQTISNL